MRTLIQGPLVGTTAGAIAETALRACVHCGMCNATCPTYQLTGDELEGPRGRIYLMKQALEGAKPTQLTLDHLDSCLLCRACETTCPSGVIYHELYDVGHTAVVEAVGRSVVQRLIRRLIAFATTTPMLFKGLVGLGRLVRFSLPAALKSKLPPRVAVGQRPDTDRTRQMLLLTGCVQSAVAEHFNAATARVFDRLSINLAEPSSAGCCGAVHHHLDAPDRAKGLARNNLEAWGAAFDAGAEALVANSSGCAAFIRDYPTLLRDDPDYADLAKRVASLVRDPIEVLEREDLIALRTPTAPRIAVHEPCTLQHGLKLTGRIAPLLERLGYDPQPVADNHLCCGSAGAYSLLHPKMAGQLKAGKLTALNGSNPDAIFTANIGCWMHLADGSQAPVRHWIEAVDEVTGPQP
jgi:glycolate oxidase iron-sulfur subunit